MTPAHLEGPYMQMYRRSRRELNPENSENGSKMRRFTTHIHTSNLQGRSKPIKRVLSESDNNESEHTGTRTSAKNKLESPGR